MAAPRKRPADLTGKRNEDLVKKNQEELAARADELSTMQKIEAEAKKEVVDYTQRDEPVAEAAPKVEIKDKVVEMRVNSDIDQMTFGKNPDGTLNNFDFEEGRRYKVPQAIYDHLDELGYVWH